ncbi:PadR family transcriptional regulator [Bacillus sp. AK128]
MEERLKNFKRAMKENVLEDLTFSEDQKKSIRQQIKNMNESSEENMLLSILQLLMQERTGFELYRLLRARGLKQYEDKEGLLYSSLHQLEQKGYLHSNWKDYEQKSYQLTNKGKKILKTIENKDRSKLYNLKELLREVTICE